MQINLTKLFFTIFIFIQTFDAIAQNPPTITPCGSTQDICLTGPIHDFCVQITVFSGLPAAIDYFTLDWGDKSTIDTIRGSNNPANQTHPYDLSEFYRTCEYSKEYFVLLRTYLTNGSVLNNSFLLTFFNPPTAEFDLLQSIVCLGGQVSIANKSCPAQELSIPTVDWGDGTPATTDVRHKYEALGSYTVTIMVSNKCGTDSHSEAIEVVSPAEANAIAVDGIVLPATDPYLVCLGEGAAVTLDGCISTNATTYGWDVVSGKNYKWLTSRDSCRPEIRFEAPGSLTIELTVNNACNQPDDVQLEFQIIEASTLKLQKQLDGCSSLNYSPSPLMSDANYVVDDEPISNSNFPITLGLGQHTVTATLNNECGTQILKDTFVVTPPVDVEIVFPLGDTIVCAGSKVHLYSEPFDGEWIGSNLIIDGKSVNFQSNTTGDFLLIYQRGEGVCKRVDSLTITVEGISAQVDNIQICPGVASFPLKGTPPNGNWSCPQCPSCIEEGDFVVGNLPDGMTSVQVFYAVSSNNGCESNTSATIEILAPSSKFSISSAVCTNSTLDVDFLESIGENFIWRIDGQEVSPPPFAGLTPGQHFIELVAVSGDCRDSISQSIEILLPPSSAGFMADQLVGCPPLPVIFTPTIDSSGEYDYAWSFNRFSNDVFKGFTPPEFIEFDNNTDSVVVYPVTFTSYNQCGESSQNLLVSVSPLPLARIGIDSIKTGCSPFEVILTNRSSGNPDSCFWSITDGFTLPSLQDTIHRVFHAADTSIEYFVTLNAINECGVSKAFDTITVIPPGVSAFYNLEEYLVCAYESVKFEDASTPFPTNWLWNFGDGFFSTEPNPVHVFNTPNDTFQVLLTVSTGCGSDNIVRTVITLPAPIVDFDLPPYGCQGQPVEGIKNFSEPNSLYLWEYNKGEQGENIYEPMPVFIDGGVTVSVKLTVTDFLNGCFNFLEKPLYIRNRPKADFALSDSSGCQVLNGETINLSKDANTWLWRLNDRDLAASENIGYSFRDLGKQDIQLIASWDEVCMDSLTKTVTVVECGVYVPSAFSPNNDGTNDFFTIYGTPTVRRVKSFKVFSRRGDMVFERYDFPANVETKGWDGTLDGKYMNPAVFVWIADVEFVDGTVGRFKGDVTLVK